MEKEITITKEQYDKLNEYYNDVCLGLLINDKFFLDNSYAFGRLTTYIFELLDNLKKEQKKEDCLTFLEIFDKAKEIIEKINPNYLKDFDDIIDKGILEVDYEKLEIPFNERTKNDAYFNANYDGRTEVYNPDKGNIHMEVSFNYDAIIILIHEFFHKINHSDNKARYLLSEYISIYFELYAYEMLKKQGIDKNKLSLNERLYNLLYNAEFLNRKGFFLGVFDKFGKYDDSMYDFLNYSHFSRNQFNIALLTELKEFEQYEEEYNNSEEFKQEYTTKQDYITSKYNRDYIYFLGTILAYYSLYNIDKKKVLSLNEELAKNKKMTLDDALNILGITLDDQTIENALNSIYTYIKENNLYNEDEISKGL